VRSDETGRDPPLGVRKGSLPADMQEATRLAATIEKWWPEIEGFLALGRPGRLNLDAQGEALTGA